MLLLSKTTNPLDPGVRWGTNGLGTPPRKCHRVASQVALELTLHIAFFAPYISCMKTGAKVGLKNIKFYNMCGAEGGRKRENPRRSLESKILSLWQQGQEHFS